MSLKHLIVPVGKKGLKKKKRKQRKRPPRTTKNSYNDGSMPKGHKSQLKEFPVIKDRTIFAIK